MQTWRIMYSKMCKQPRRKGWQAIKECSPEIHPKRSNKEEVPLRRFPLVPKVSLLVPVGAVCQRIQLPHHKVLQQTQFTDLTRC